MGVIISYKGGSKAADIIEEATRWHFGSNTVKLYGADMSVMEPLVEITASDVARLEQTDTPLRRFKGLKEKE
ncbi:hypothetical protein LCGC14_1057040 [marine sediment metagenome]|uniref:Uncharacterized protein n=1 Tax=marine sediment metagenome TaxID=412755 RepID=A0A0F9Q588_9ZZZZ|nr:hypothetical protein [Methylophaga sp.]